MPTQETSQEGPSTWRGREGGENSDEAAQDSGSAAAPHASGTPALPLTQPSLANPKLQPRPKAVMPRRRWGAGPLDHWKVKDPCSPTPGPAL